MLFPHSSVCVCCACIYVHACVRVWVRTCMRVCMHACMHVCMCMCMRAYMCECMCVLANTVDAYSWDTCFAIRSHACTVYALVNYLQCGIIGQFVS